MLPGPSPGSAMLSIKERRVQCPAEQSLRFEGNLRMDWTQGSEASHPNILGWETDYMKVRRDNRFRGSAVRHPKLWKESGHGRAASMSLPESHKRDP